MFIGGYFETDANGTYGYEDIFKDYSTHEMKIFYMERGAGASNLHMRFNQLRKSPASKAGVLT